MARCGQDVSALAPAIEGWQASRLLVVGGDGAHADRVRGSERSVILGELNNSTQARWLKTIEVFNEQGESHQLKLFPSQPRLPSQDDEQVARVLVDKVRTGT